MPTDFDKDYLKALTIVAKNAVADLLMERAGVKRIAPGPVHQEFARRLSKELDRRASMRQRAMRGRDA